MAWVDPCNHSDWWSSVPIVEWNRTNGQRYPLNFPNPVYLPSRPEEPHHNYCSPTSGRQHFACLHRCRQSKTKNLNVNLNRRSLYRILTLPFPHAGTHNWWLIPNRLLLLYVTPVLDSTWNFAGSIQYWHICAY